MFDSKYLSPQNKDLLQKKKSVYQHQDQTEDQREMLQSQDLEEIKYSDQIQDDHYNQILQQQKQFYSQLKAQQEESFEDHNVQITEPYQYTVKKYNELLDHQYNFQKNYPYYGVKLRGTPNKKSVLKQQKEFSSQSQSRQMKCLKQDHGGVNIIGICLDPFCEVNSRLCCLKCIQKLHFGHVQNVISLEDILNKEVNLLQGQELEKRQILNKEQFKMQGNYLKKIQKRAEDEISVFQDRLKKEMEIFKHKVLESINYKSILLQNLYEQQQDLSILTKLRSEVYELLQGKNQDQVEVDIGSLINLSKSQNLEDTQINLFNLQKENQLLEHSFETSMLTFSKIKDQLQNVTKFFQNCLFSRTDLQEQNARYFQMESPKYNYSPNYKNFQFSKNLTSPKTNNYTNQYFLKEKEQNKKQDEIQNNQNQVILVEKEQSPERFQQQQQIQQLKSPNNKNYKEISTSRLKIFELDGLKQAPAVPNYIPFETRTRSISENVQQSQLRAFQNNQQQKNFQTQAFQEEANLKQSMEFHTQQREGYNKISYENPLKISNNKNIQENELDQNFQLPGLKNYSEQNSEIFNTFGKLQDLNNIKQKQKRKSGVMQLEYSLGDQNIQIQDNMIVFDQSCYGQIGTVFSETFESSDFATLVFQNTLKYENQPFAFGIIAEDPDERYYIFFNDLGECVLKTDKMNKTKGQYEKTSNNNQNYKNIVNRPNLLENCTAKVGSGNNTLKSFIKNNLEIKFKIFPSAQIFKIQTQGQHDIECPINIKKFSEWRFFIRSCNNFKVKFIESQVLVDYSN